MYSSFGSAEAAATSRAVCASPARMEDGCRPENGLWEPQQGVDNFSLFLHRREGVDVMTMLVCISMGHFMCVYQTNPLWLIKSEAKVGLVRSNHI